MYEVILHYMVKEEEKEKNVISAHPGIDPGPLVPKYDTQTTRPRCQVVRGSKLPYTLDRQSKYRPYSYSNTKYNLRNFVHC